MYGHLRIYLLQDVFPMRLKAVHLVNEPSIFSTIFAIVKPFLKEKTVKRVCVISLCLLWQCSCNIPWFSPQSRRIIHVTIINLYIFRL